MYFQPLTSHAGYEGLSFREQWQLLGDRAGQSDLLKSNETLFSKRLSDGPSRLFGVHPNRAQIEGGRMRIIG